LIHWITTTARDEDHSPFALEQTFGTRGCVSKRHTSKRNVVEIGSQRRWHTEVVHRHTDRNDIGATELGDQFIGELRGLLLLG
jgi:hypothetical protein